MEFGNPIVGQEDLIRSAIKSPNFNTDPENGNVTGWRIAADGSATFYNLTIGSTSFNIDQAGNAVFNDITVNGQLYLNGQSVADQLMNMARGVIAVVDSNTSGGDTAAEFIWCKVTIPNFDPTREYELVGIMHADVQTSAPTYINAGARVAWNADATTASTSIGRMQWGGRSTSQTDLVESYTIHFTNADLPAGSGDLHISMTMDASVTGTRFQADVNTRLWVKDIGPVIPHGTFNISGGGTPPTQYVKTYSANESASYQENGSNRGVASCYQGRYSATNGNQYSMIGFDDATIRADLAGSTINKVELYLNNNHFYSNSGGNAVIGTHNQTTLSGSHSSSQINDNLQQTHFDLGQAKWITIPNSIGNALRDNTAKGIALGPGPTTSQSYYGYFAGNGESGEPQLRITYTK